MSWLKRFYNNGILFAIFIAAMAFKTSLGSVGAHYQLYEVHDTLAASYLTAGRITIQGALDETI